MRLFEGPRLGRFSTKSVLAGGAAVASLAGVGVLGVNEIGSQSRAAAATHCTYPKANNVEPPLHLNTTDTDGDYCVVQALPMGETNILDGHQGELGLVDVKIRVAGKLLDCVLPISNPGSNNAGGEIAVEAFSLKNSCEPDNS